MTKDDIIRMAKEAEMPYNYRSGEINNLNPLKRFANLVAAYERQPCQTCESLARAVMMDQTGRDA